MADASDRFLAAGAPVSTARARAFTRQPSTLGHCHRNPSQPLAVGTSGTYDVGDSHPQPTALRCVGIVPCTRLMADIRIGTSGFHYKHWCGPFYPEKLPAAKMLGHY